MVDDPKNDASFDEPSEDKLGEDDADAEDVSAAEPANSPDEPEQTGRRDKRWKLGRDVLVFQGKLAMDWLRDLVLAPVSIGAAIYGVLAKPEEPGHYFYEVMRWGRRSDKFINLFSAGQDPEEEDTFPSVDDLVGSLEDVIVKEYDKGGMTAEAKSHIDKTLDKLDETLERDRSTAKRHIKAATERMKHEIKKAKQVLTPPEQENPPTDEPPAPSA